MMRELRHREHEHEVEEQLQWRDLVRLIGCGRDVGGREIFGHGPTISCIDQFRAVTAMSPLQFQKQIRLQEARRLMIGEDLDAARAGYRVGYDDASHFTREYKRLFGEPPMRDVQRLRATATVSSDL